MATEFVGIELRLMGVEGVKRDLQSLDKLLDSFRGKKQFNAGFNEAKNQVVQYRGELEKLRREQAKMEKGSAEWKAKGAQIESVKNKLRDAQQAVREFGRASQQAGKTFMQTFNSISSKAAHIGSAMQSLGNAMTRLTSPFSRLTTGLLYGAGYKALNLFTEGLSGTFERADTMKLYPKMLQEFGFSAKESSEAIKTLEESVLGLPTGLDEIVAVQKRFVAASQDMDKSTGLAIAYNNAILASGSDARQQWTAQRILTQLAGGAEIAATSWDALQRAIPLVFTELSKDAKMGVGDYVSALKTGQISTEEFMKDFTKIGGKGGAISAAAMTMTKSWQGLTANIQNATKRMGTAILDTLHEVFKDKTGRDLLDTLLGIDAEGNRTYDGIRDWIDGMSTSIQDWIKANPDKILDFFDKLKSIDWKGFLKGMAEGMGDFLKVMGMFAEWASNRDMERLGRWIPRLNLIGRGLTILGGVLKGTRHFWGFLGAGALKLGGKFGKIGIFGKLVSILGKKKDIDTAADVGKAVTKASPRLISAFKNMALLSGIIAMPSLTAWGVTASARASVKNFKETVDLLKDVNWDDAKKVLAGIGTYLGGSAVAGGLIGKFGVTAGTYAIIGETIAGVITSIATGFLAVNMSNIKSGLKNFADAMRELSAIPELGDADAIFEKVKNAIEIYNRVAELLNGEAPEVVTAQSVNGGMGKGIKGIGFFKALDIKNLADSIKSLVDMGDLLNQLASIQLPENAEANAEKVARTASNVAYALGSLSGGFGGYSNIANAVGSWGIKATMTNVANQLIELRRMAYHLSALSSVSIPANAETKAKILTHTVSRIAYELGKFGSGFGGWGQIASSGGIKKTMSNIADQLIQLRRMAYHINKLAGTNINESGFAGFIEQLKTALGELKGMGELIELDIEVKLSDKFGTSVTNAINKIKDAKKKIQQQKSSISFTIPVSVTFSVTTNFGAALAGILGKKDRLKGAGGSGLSHSSQGSAYGGSVPSATGGLIYRAKGGRIPFKRRGTDTVPAMLTPGEFVHNKQAVNLFGETFMRRVNNLDVKGAMSELMHKAGNMANANRGTVVNNTYNNNQKVVVNNNGNTGAGFTFKSASRFVGAL